MNEHQEKRLAELRELQGKARSLSTDEYRDALKEIQAGAVLSLQIKMVEGENKGTGSLINLIEKVHWLIDSIESKDEKPKDDNYSINIFFKHTEDDDKQI